MSRRAGARGAACRSPCPSRTRIDDISEAPPTGSRTIRLSGAQSALGRAAAATSEPALSGASHAADPCLWTIVLPGPASTIFQRHRLLKPDNTIVRRTIRIGPCSRCHLRASSLRGITCCGPVSLDNRAAEPAAEPATQVHCRTRSMCQKRKRALEHAITAGEGAAAAALTTGEQELIDALTAPEP